MEQFGTFVTHHWELFLALAVIIILLINSEFMGSLSGIRAADPMEATGLINHESAIVLDIREEHEFREGHILNSKHIPISQVKGRLKELERFRNTPIIVGCRTGHRSRHACSVMRKEGFQVVYNLKGGILAWQNANLPLYKK
jgi:rhodanese-related sulfurtransferase